MQRRNFISNLAVILPAGMVAPKLLFEDKPPYIKLIESSVLVLGAGNAGLFIAKKLKKEKVATVLLEPSNGTKQAALYDHSVTAGVIKQRNKYQPAEVQSVAHHEYDELNEIIVLDFVPTEIRKTVNGFIITDGTTAYCASKLIIALPVQMDTANASLKVSLNGQETTVAICCKRKNKINPASFSTLSAAKIDEQQVLKFATQKSPGILAVL
jgi:hypothetical protein